MSHEIQDIRPLSYNHEIEQVHEEDCSVNHNPNPNDSQESHHIPNDHLLSSIQPHSRAIANSELIFNRYNWRFFTFILSVFLVTILTFLLVVLVYYKPIPPRLELDIPKVHIHNFAVNNINTTFSFRFSNPNPRINLDLIQIVANLHFGYRSHISKTLLLPAISLKIHQYKFVQVNFFDKILEFKPENNSTDVLTPIKHKRYIFSMIIEVKLKVHLEQISVTFPYTVVSKCFIMANGYSSADSPLRYYCK